jgi:hypothetical protein
MNAAAPACDTSAYQACYFALIKPRWVYWSTGPLVPGAGDDWGEAMCTWHRETFTCAADAGCWDADLQAACKNYSTDCDAIVSCVWSTWLP